MKYVSIIIAWITFWLACLIYQGQTAFVAEILAPIIAVLVLSVGIKYLIRKLKLHR